MILTHRTEFELALKDMSKASADMGNQLAKLAGAANRLHKAAEGADGDTRAAEILAEMKIMMSLVKEDHESVARAHAALPAFRAHVLGTGDAVRFAIAEKSFDSCGSELVALWPRQQPAADPAAAVGDTELRHRFQQHPKP